MSRSTIAVVVTAVATFLAMRAGDAAPPLTCIPSWNAQFGERPGVEGLLFAMAPFDDGRGAGEQLIVGGIFFGAGSAPANLIARWDGQGWSAVGAQPNAAVNALAVFDDGSGPALYVGGAFTVVDGQPLSYIARWDGETWSALGSRGHQGVNDVVWALTVHDDGSGPALFVGGAFTMAGGVSTGGVAKWDGEQWSTLDGGVNGPVLAMTTFTDPNDGLSRLVIGGVFSSAGGSAAAPGGSISATSIAAWDGASWSAFGTGIIGIVWALETYPDGLNETPTLYAGGDFAIAGGAQIRHVARWDGAAWLPLGSGIPPVNTIVGALRTVDLDGEGPILIVGGRFSQAGGVTAHNIARWNGAAWSAMGGGFSSSSFLSGAVVRALVIHDDQRGAGPQLFAGGGMSAVSPSGGAVNAGLVVDGIARWTGEWWDNLGDGLSDPVDDLLVDDAGAIGDPALYVAGAFITANSAVIRRVARWDGESFHALGNGPTNRVRSLVIHDDGLGLGPALYAGGPSTLMRWNGTAWETFGPLTSWSGTVYDMVSFDEGFGTGTALYVVGAFGTVGGQPFSRVARWDGEFWLPLFGGLDPDDPTTTARVAIVFDDGAGDGPAIYIGGSFTVAGMPNGPIQVNRIARWTGSAWTALGTGIEGVSVTALTAHDDGSGPALYAGGLFSAAGGVAANNIARWDGAQWSAIGGGLDGEVLALTVHDDGTGRALYAGGDFKSAAGEPAQRLAKWDGRAWSAVAEGMTAPVRAMVSIPVSVEAGSEAGAALVIGGDFLGSPAGDSFLALWQGCPSDPGCAVADLNCDGVVDGADLGLLLSNWGNAGVGDINEDGVVDGADLGLLLAGWG